MRREYPAIPFEGIIRRILIVRGRRVMLSADLAALYGVEPRVLVQAVKRNRRRFPADFMFQLSRPELANLKSQIVISSWGGSRRAPPYAFTEQGVAMLSSVLRSERAILINVTIMRAFVRLRQWWAQGENLKRKIRGIESRCDGRYAEFMEAMRRLMDDSPGRRERIGFHPRKRKSPGPSDPRT